MNEQLPDDALVCRGGLCGQRNFESGSGVSVSTQGVLSGVSVNCSPGASLEALCASIPNRKVGVTTVSAIRADGGTVRPAPTSRNPLHCVMSGLTGKQAEALFTPVRPNPNLDD